MCSQTPERIAQQCDHLDGQANIRAINELFRQQDDSHLWPICNNFNATERAIRTVRRFRRDYGPIYGLEYALVLESEISRIVNSI